MFFIYLQPYSFKYKQIYTNIGVVSLLGLLKGWKQMLLYEDLTSFILYPARLLHWEETKKVSGNNVKALAVLHLKPLWTPSLDYNKKKKCNSVNYETRTNQTLNWNLVSRFCVNVCRCKQSDVASSRLDTAADQSVSQSVRKWPQPLMVLNQVDRMEVPNTVSVLVCGAALCRSVCRSTPVQADGVSVWTHKCPDFELWAGDGKLYFFKRPFFYIDMNVYLFCKDAGDGVSHRWLNRVVLYRLW